MNPVANSTGKKKLGHSSFRWHWFHCSYKGFPQILPLGDKGKNATSPPPVENTVLFDKPTRKLLPAFHQHDCLLVRCQQDQKCLGADSEKVMETLGCCLSHMVLPYYWQRQKNWCLSYCIEHFYILSLPREISFSTFLSICSRGQMISRICTIMGREQTRKKKKDH